MAKAKNQAAHDAVVKARSMLLIKNPFFGTLALHLRLVEILDPEGPYGDTMAVDGVRMYYWPEFVLKLTEPELMAVVAHEVMHCALSHMTRRGHRQPEVWNWAGDYRINWDLTEAGFKLPGTPMAWSTKYKEGTRGHLYDPKFKDMGSEEIYERLKQDTKFVTIMLVSGNDPAGGMGIVLDAGKPGDQATAEKVAHDWEATVRMAINVAQRHAGKLPGYLQRLVDQLEAPRVNWRDVLRRFIDNTSKKDFTWTRPNRRFVGQGLHLPGERSESMHHLVTAIDISGSINDDMMREMVSEAASALEAGITDKLTIIYADDGVRKVDVFVEGDQVRADSPGGGGTDFRDTFEWIRKNASDASAIVYLTDMMTSSFGEDPDKPVLWGVYLPRSMLNNVHPPFGEIVEVSVD